MTFGAVIDIIDKGLKVIETLETLGESTLPAIQALKRVTEKGTQITQADLDATEKVLDDLVDQFNAEIE